MFRGIWSPISTKMKTKGCFYHGRGKKVEIPPPTTQTKVVLYVIIKQWYEHVFPTTASFGWSESSLLGALYTWWPSCTRVCMPWCLFCWKDKSNATKLTYFYKLATSSERGIEISHILLHWADTGCCSCCEYTWKRVGPVVDVVVALSSTTIPTTTLKATPKISDLDNLFGARWRVCHRIIYWRI